MTEPEAEYTIDDPPTIGDNNLTTQQAQVLYMAIKRIMGHGWGRVTLVITNHKVDRIETAISEKVIDN